MSAAKEQGPQGLRVWQTGMELTRIVYALTRQFPSTEQHGLAAQMRRAAVSVVSNVAEGHARPRRPGAREFRQFVGIALGSTAELETQLEIAKGEGYAPDGDIERALDKVRHLGAMLRRLHIALANAK